MLNTATYHGRIWGVPKQADVGLLFYRADRVRSPPTTWQDLYRAAKVSRAGQPFQNANEGWLRYEGYAYEGLTVNFLEVAYAAGATDIVNGGDAAIDQPATETALAFMVNGIRDHAVPYYVAQSRIERIALDGFLDNHADFLRWWPSAYAEAKARLPGKVGVEALPKWQGRGGASVLGGHNLVISAASKNPEAALKLINYLTSIPVMISDAAHAAVVPARQDQEIWSSPDVNKGLPVPADIQREIRTAKLRPQVPNYPNVSRAIYYSVNQALLGRADFQSALLAAQQEMQDALDHAPQ